MGVVRVGVKGGLMWCSGWVGLMLVSIGCELEYVAGKQAGKTMT